MTQLPFFQLVSFWEIISTIRKLSFISTLRDDQIATFEKMLNEFVGDIFKNKEGKLCLFQAVTYWSFATLARVRS
jgi:hypothetical protein